MHSCRNEARAGRRASGFCLPRRILGAALLALVVAMGGARPAASLQETPALAQDVAAGHVPPIEQRLPVEPLTVDLKAADREIGHQGGTLRMLIGTGADARSLLPFGYARLVGYDLGYNIAPDILRAVDVVEDRIFTLHLRRGHKWSDGAPFTAEDFRYWWEDVAQNRDLSPDGPPPELMVNGAPPRVEYPDELTVRYSWDFPNQAFLPALAAASPLTIYRPAHYLKRFHLRYAEPVELANLVAAAKAESWAMLHDRRDTSVTLSNPEMPTLQPWVNVSRPLGQVVEMQRNPYYHRIDADGRQLPYIDKVVLTPAPLEEIPARTAAGESDLQAFGLDFGDLPMLRDADAKGFIKLRQWPIGRGTQLALYPNLTAADPVMRALLRDVRFRRALSTAIDRDAINEKVYGGAAKPRANSVLRDSPLFNPDAQVAWAELDPARAGELLNEVGLKLDPELHVRRLPDGRPLSLMVSSDGKDPSELAVLQIVQASWRKVGIEMLIEASDPDRFRARVLAGEAPLSIGPGLANGLATSAMSPRDLAPTDSHQNQWPQWGLYVETGGTQGQPIDVPEAAELAHLSAAWRDARSDDEKTDIWREILKIHAEQLFTIGLVGEVPQPVAVSRKLHNLPKVDYYNWEPGAYFGIYRPDTFWME